MQTNTILAALASMFAGSPITHKLLAEPEIVMPPIVGAAVPRRRSKRGKYKARLHSPSRRCQLGRK